MDDLIIEIMKTAANPMPTSNREDILEIVASAKLLDQILERRLKLDLELKSCLAIVLSQNLVFNVDLYPSTLSHTW